MSDDLHAMIERARDAQGDVPETYDIPNASDTTARCYFCGKRVDVDASTFHRVTAWESDGTLAMIEHIDNAYACDACIEKRGGKQDPLQESLL